GSSSMDPRTWTRSYAGNAYLAPNIGRENLCVLTHALVSRILFKDEQSDGLQVTNGVEFIYQGNTYTVNVHKEVILNAGSIKSPHILELSGIGRPEILRDIGVPVLIELPGVGENAQDHLATTVVYELNPTAGHEAVDLLNDPEYAARANSL
ncbi:hypothetical protein CPC08DRAFT_645304, partial [Agrocybe pediades]